MVMDEVLSPTPPTGNDRVSENVSLADPKMAEAEKNSALPLVGNSILIEGSGPKPELREEIVDVAGQEESAEEDVDDAPDSDPTQHVLDLEYEDASHWFVRRGGNIYIPNSMWNRYTKHARNAHIYISMAGATVGGLNSKPAAYDFELPRRVRILNRILVDELSRIMGGEINPDMVPPFRSLIPSEQKIRAMHEEREQEFKRLAAQHPDDENVKRKEPWLPSVASYGTKGVVGKVDGVICRERLLLDGLRALIYFFDNNLSDLVQTYQNIDDGSVEKIRFDYLWYLFQPGQDIIHCQKNQVFQVLKVTGGRISLIPREGRNKHLGRKTISNLSIDCFYLDFDGNSFGPMQEKVEIPPYEDEVPIKSLPIYPLKYDKKIEEDMIARGKNFEVLVKTIAHRRYKGLSLREGDLYRRLEDIDSDIIIDFELAFRDSEPNIVPPEFIGANPKLTEEDAEESNDKTCDFSEYEKTTPLTRVTLQSGLLERQSIQSKLSAKRLKLLPLRVYGYVLLSRKWYPLDIQLVKLIEPLKKGERDAFHDLILPDGHKDIVRALVKTHTRVPSSLNPSRREFDLVKGKGRGLIILLHGAPGVGKTSTAECVAANTGRPLFPITCGDIGGKTAQEVEKNLERFFDLARQWGCVLLLDEADVFLAERNRTDIRQNSLVSVFLRVLEYYSGILILTTNRVGTFDEAIKSRVHCALYYPPLSPQQTIEVWKMNIKRLRSQTQTIDFSDKTIIAFANAHWKAGNRWNGRQIKNAFQTAVALAEWDHMNEGTPETRPRLDWQHFETVANASRHFDKYLEKLHGKNVVRFKGEHLRDDEVGMEIDDSEVEKKKRKARKKKAVRELLGESSTSEEEEIVEKKKKGKKKMVKTNKKKKKKVVEESDDDDEEEEEDNEIVKTKKKTQKKKGKPEASDASEASDEEIQPVIKKKPKKPVETSSESEEQEEEEEEETEEEKEEPIRKKKPKKN